MEDFSEARKRMVQNQIVVRGIKDRRVIDAMIKVPRHEFITLDLWNQAYNDYPLPTDCNQTISQPYIVALMTELLGLKRGDEKVLEIGTGSGYQTAILAELSASVYSVERFSKLTLRAKEILNRLEYKNINIKTDDGTRGWAEFAPYDAIIVTASTPQVPQPLIDQLKDNGRMVIPVGARFSQDLTLVRKERGNVTAVSHSGCVFVPLIGDYGWKD